MLEVDGNIHDREDVRIKDNHNTRILKDLGYIVIRVTNETCNKWLGIRTENCGMLDGFDEIFMSYIGGKISSHKSMLKYFYAVAYQGSLTKFRREPIPIKINQWRNLFCQSIINQVGKDNFNNWLDGNIELDFQQ